MGKHQLTKVTAKLQVGPHPVVTTEELGELAGHNKVEQTWDLIKRLKRNHVIGQIPRMKGIYGIVGRTISRQDIADAWLRCHPAQGRVVNPRYHLDRIGAPVPLVEVTLHARPKGLEHYVTVSRVRNLHQG